MDVFVFQMGKVASTSITHAIRREGLNAVQTHWLGRDKLIGSLDNTLLNVNIDEATAFRGIQQFTENIRNTRTLLWYREHKRHKGYKLKIVTLSRDPLSWYWGHLAENFDLYSRRILEWYRHVYDHPDADINLYHATTVFHEALFDSFGAISEPVGSPRFAREAGRQRCNGVHVPFLSQQLMKLRLPTMWFDIVFRPTVDIDIYEHQFDPSSGVARYENSFADVLLIRYENLAQAVEPLKDFLGVQDLSLAKANTTSDKALDIDFKELAARIRPTPSALEKLYASHYCRFFGYRPQAIDH